MISDRGIVSDESGNKIHNWLCLNCGYKMSTNVHWGKKKGLEPQKCPDCGVFKNAESITQL